MTSLEHLIIFLVITAIAVAGVLLSGCAYKGDVYIYSPSGAENVIEKAISTDASLTGL